MASSVCVDASILLKVVLPEQLSDEAADLLTAWDAAQVALVAPSLLPYELASSIYKNVQQGHLTEQAGRDGLALLKQIEVQFFLPDDLDEAAWSIALRCGQAVLYGSYYLALAELLACDYWTADERFHRAASNVSSKVRLLGQDQF